MMESWIIDQLAQQGVSHFCIAPGSRNTPLVSVVAEHKKAQLHIHYDERGIGFYALGLAKGTRKPPVVICTSGTAAGNLLPSVMEAHHSCIPFILLTADRPLELRDCGANQATDQVKMFHSFVRWQTDLSSPLNEGDCRSIAVQSYFQACKNPAGPIQINIAFREPFCTRYPPIVEGKPIELRFPRHSTAAYKTARSKGVILIGRLPAPEDLFPILELAKRLQWPICADILSNARCHPTPEQIRHFDWIEKPKPDFALHFGERMTSKRLLEWLAKIKPESVHVSPSPFLQDPARILTGRVQSDIPEFCRTFEGETDQTWLHKWDDREPHFEEGGPFTEAHAMRAISEILPPDFAVFLGNGMPIRDGNHFLFPKKCRGFFGNRGLSGIDGNIATIAGLAQEMPILGIIGDQTALYDLNSLALLKKTKYPAILLISNNFGGGMFHHLPIVQSPHFERLWAAAHSFRFEFAAKMFELPYFPFKALEQLFQSNRSAVVELITDRTVNCQYQKSFTAQFKAEIQI